MVPKRDSLIEVKQLTTVLTQPATRSALLDALAPTIAVVAVITALPAQRALPLAPDAENYLALADTFGWASLWGGSREPVWPLLLSGPVNLLGPHPSILRAFGILFFPLLALAFQQLAAQLLPMPWARAAAVLLALSPWLRLQSLEGLREVPATAGLLALATWLIARSGVYGKKQALLLGLAAGGLALLRWDTLLLTLPLLLLSAALRRAPVRSAAVALVTAAAVTAPLTLGNLDRYGDPLHHSNVHATFFRNAEFGGLPGYPSREQLAIDAYAGAPSTWGEYLFVEHSISEVVGRTLSGAPSAVLDVGHSGLFGYHDEQATALEVPTLRLLRSVTTAFPWLLLAGVAAGLVLLTRRRAWHALALTAGVTLQHAPIEARMDLRLGMAVFPLSLLCLLLSLHAWRAHQISRR